MQPSMPERQVELAALMRDILQERYVSLSPLRFNIDEDLAADSCRICCDLRRTPGGVDVHVEGTGVGAVDALFHGLQEHYAAEHLSLNSITFYDFQIRGQPEPNRAGQGADSQVLASLRIRNSYGSLFEFRGTSRSIIRAAILATLSAVEYFINSERATVALYGALEHARTTGREDTVAAYTVRLARLVQNASYTEVIERIRERCGPQGLDRSQNES